jgi:hypothetical protein
VPPQSSGGWKDLIHAAEVAKTLIKIANDTKKIATFALGGALELFISVIIFGPDRSEPFFEVLAAQAMRRLMDELQQGGIVNDNIDLFMAACDRNDHSPPHSEGVQVGTIVPREEDTNDKE